MPDLKKLNDKKKFKLMMKQNSPTIPQDIQTI